MPPAWLKTLAVAAVGVGATCIAIAIVRKYFRGRKRVIITLKDKTVKYALRLVDKEIISHDTKRFQFALPSKDHILGHFVGHHIYVSANIGGDIVVRPYTPITSPDNTGYFELLIKIYNKNSQFPEGGKMTQYLDSVPIGDYVEIRGPGGLLIYNGNGHFAIKPNKQDPSVPRSASRLGLIAGGSGITPMLQIIRAIFNNSKDKTEVSLIFANKSDKDILLQDELDDIVRTKPHQFKVWYTVDKAPEGWKFSEGFVTAEMIKQYLPSPADDVLIMACGPKAMIDNACLPSLKSLGYLDKHLFVF